MNVAEKCLSASLIKQLKYANFVMVFARLPRLINLRNVTIIYKIFFYFSLASESSHCRIWNIRFDKDIVQTIRKKFPYWFLPLKSKTRKRAEWSAHTQTMEQQEKRVSPPKAIVDSSPLQSAMDKNRECKNSLSLMSLAELKLIFHFHTTALKVKLLVRRSANQLVEQGILPRKIASSISIHFRSIE